MYLPIYHHLYARFPGGTMGHDRRALSNEGSWYCRWIHHLHGAHFRVHRRQDVPILGAYTGEARCVYPVRMHLVSGHCLLLPLPTGNQGQNSAGDRRLLLGSYQVTEEVQTAGSRRSTVEQQQQTPAADGGEEQVASLKTTGSAGRPFSFCFILQSVCHTRKWEVFFNVLP